MSKCPFMNMQKKPNANPQQALDLNILRPPNHGDGSREQYMKDFASLDLAAVKKDISAALKDSKSWWPADYGHYGPFMIRLAWHAAGTYRSADGRGGANSGNMRFNPLGSWRDNGNLDKARRLLWPIKQKYGKKLGWGDLMILVGYVAHEDMGHKQLGFMGGRVDCWSKEEEVYWGSEHESFKGLAHNPSALEQPLGAVEHNLIYVNPEGPDGIPDPLLAAGHIRETFGRMAMNDEETVALIAGGHTFGKCHGAAPGGPNQGPAPCNASIEEQGFGWTNKFGTGSGNDTITSGLEGAWTTQPAKWDHGYFHNLFNYEWELYKGPGGANQWRPKGGAGKDSVPMAHGNGKTHPIMLTTDLALRMDPAYEKVSRSYLENPDKFSDAYARAWYKLTHRDMGPARRGLGPDCAPEQLWQDPVPSGNPKLSAGAVQALKEEIKKCGLTNTQLVKTAWASAATWRHTDFRGGANGARVTLSPQKDWDVNEPEKLRACLDKLAAVKEKWTVQPVSMADIIVLAGCVGVEEAAKKAGNPVNVGFSSGRGDATAANTDPKSFAYLEPKSDPFRNYSCTPYMMVDRAHLMQLSAQEMVVLMAGMRAMGANSGSSDLGVLTDTPGNLDNKFFINLLDMAYKWEPSGEIYEGKDRATGATKWTASACDLALGSNFELRNICEHYACDDSKQDFADAFAKAWQKVMESDMYDGKF